MNWASPMASATVATVRAPLRMSSAPAASALASAWGKERGRTRTKSVRAMFFMARATDPILPGWLGSMRTMRTRAVMSLVFYREYAAPLEHRHACRPARRRLDRAQSFAPRFPENRQQRPQRFRDRHRPQG